jgi:hypothetical protein
MEGWKITFLVMVGILMLMPFGAIFAVRADERQKKEWDALSAPSLPKLYVSDKRAIWLHLAMLGLAALIFIVPMDVFALTLCAQAVSDLIAALGAIALAALTGVLIWGLVRAGKNPGYRLWHPDQLVLSAEGVCCDSLGVRRQWRWNEIEGARGRSLGRYNTVNYLALKLYPGVDVQHVRSEPRIGHCTQALLPPYWTGARFYRGAASDIAADIRAVMRAQGREPLSDWMESQDWPGQALASRSVSR